MHCHHCKSPYHDAEDDPLLKREQFAVQLRRQKKAKLLQEKRKRGVFIDSETNSVNLSDEDIEHILRKMLPLNLKNAIWEEQLSFWVSSLQARVLTSTNDSNSVLIDSMHFFSYFFT
jgi:hypothetical protein